MGEILQKRLRQTKFESPYQEALLSIVVAANTMNEQVDHACAEFGISRQQYNILRILKGAHGDGYQCSEIASRMLDRAPDITRRIDGLEKMGLVDRMRSTEDRRVVITRITQKGLEMLESLQSPIRDFNAVLAKRLTKQECLQLVELCEKLIDLGE